MYAAGSDDTEAPPRPRSETVEGVGGVTPSGSPVAAASATRGRNEDDEDHDDEEDEGDDDDEDDDDEGDGTATVPAASNTTASGGAGGGGAGGGGAGGGAASASNMVVGAVPNLDGLFGLREIGREALCWKLSSAKPGNGVEQIRDHSIDTYWQSDGTTQPHWIQVHFARRVAISHVCLYLDYNLDESYTPKKIRVEAGMTNQDLQAAVYPANTQIEFQEPVGWCIIPLSSPPDPLDDYDEDDEDDESDEAARNGYNGENGGNHRRAACGYNSRHLVRAHLIRISVLSMHQNGRDTHVRQVQLYGPRMSLAAKLVPVHHHAAVTATSVTDDDDGREREPERRVQSSSDVGSGRWGRADPPFGARLQHHWEDDFSTVAMSQFSTIR